MVLFTFFNNLQAAADAIDIDADSNAETLSAQNIPPIKSSVPPSTNIVKPKVESYIRAEKGLHRSKFSNVASTATPAPKPTINSQGETSTSTASMPSSLAKSPGIQATTTGAQTIDLTEIDDSPQKQHKPGPTTHTNTHTNTHAHTQTNTTKNKNAHYPHPVFGDDGVESGEGPAPIHKRLNVAEANKSTGSYMGQTGVTGALDPMGEDDIDEDEPMRTTGINKAPMGISNESVIERSEDSGSGSEGASDDEEVDTGMAVDGTDSENEALLDQTDRQPSQGIER
ncbi:hypothetical protein SARC_12424 [Sphaeroforma arctica JP610]|uniref:Uncharacterized protein n=1 Tax=Sphaeroforma arctica JP610 TaxID=667725 RepID=A0A0L0FE56_9EUKA|nr:hypothetical protein SARC_12424 [Sphaeroforma arctica JP610]KNC75044.1 hypothetical protein SARC_12424 [Sphaeroforma arctica JP610]|eukprot:XP_014148946.1 hypothetical protein SARC_12424 [Sphaeroforma arctica JP610]